MQSIKFQLNKAAVAASLAPPNKSNPMDVDRSDLVVDLEDEEISVISVDISSGDESDFGSDDEEDDEDVSGKPSNCELIKKHKREHHVGDSPTFLS